MNSVSPPLSEEALPPTLSGRWPELKVESATFFHPPLRAFFSDRVECWKSLRTDNAQLAQVRATEWNARWWKHVAELQGVEPPDGPGSRGEEWCDAATKTHINDNPCYYYSYAIATVLKFQFHDYIARKILHQPPQTCNYAGNREVGAFLKKMLATGGTRDWRVLLRETTGENLSTRAMKDYFAPLQAWLEKENAGRPIGWD